MISKKYLAIGAAVVLIFLAAIAVKQLLPENKTLTREAAAEKIKLYLQNNPEKIGYGRYIRTFSNDVMSREGYYISFIDEEVKELLKEGFIENTSQPLGIGGPTSFTFTEKAKPYFVKREVNDSKDIKVILAEAASVEVTGLAEIRHGEIKADYKAAYKPTPFGEALNEKDQTTEETTFFTLYDNGWRVSP